MNFNKTELRTILLLAEHKKTKEIMETLKKSPKETYKTMNKLRKKEIIEKQEIKKEIHTTKLVAMVRKYENVIELIADSGLNIFMNLTETCNNTRTNQENRS